MIQVAVFWVVTPCGDIFYITTRRHDKLESSPPRKPQDLAQDIKITT